MHWRVLLAVALAGAVAGLSGPVSAAPGSRSADLEGRLDRALSHRSLRGARVAALVVDRDSGAVIYAHQPDRALVPASNMKVLTAIAALSAFGPTHRFVTEVLADGPPDADGAVGRLMFRGGGDPALTSELLWRLAADLHGIGVRSVREGLLLDESAFDGQRWHSSWGKVSARAYHAPVGALSVNYGAFAVKIAPGPAEGAPARVEIDPPVPFLRLAGRATTGPSRSRSSLSVERRPNGDSESVIVTGRIPAGAEVKTVHRSVLDPAGYAAAVLRLQLEANGIRVQGPVVRGTVPEGATPLLEFEGRPLAEIARLFLKYSNNAIAESLLKALSIRGGTRPATWAAGLVEMRRELAGLGVPIEGAVLVDGSGLSYENRVSPRTFVKALRVAQDSFRFGAEFVTGLPIAASDGTLEERAEGAAEAVRAKTGLLTRVTGLSGYARMGNGRVAVFSLLANGYRGSDDAAMRGVDRFVSELVTVEKAKLDVR